MEPGENGGPMSKFHSSVRASLLDANSGKLIAERQMAQAPVAGHEVRVHADQYKVVRVVWLLDVPNSNLDEVEVYLEPLSAEASR